ncbi:GspH/FimT family pseudopilin [Ottowia sp.]|uniref:GspH/FimT family pseudopilin n=1 Tax=Ottowia sp. TaxID=1898956 RepID=UPI0039E53E86
MEHPPIAPGKRRPLALRGFTAIELMVVIAIVAILAALAAPSFTPLIERWRVRQAAEDMQATLYYARSEAIKRGGGISIVPQGSGWSDGWQVMHSSTSDPLQLATAPTRTTITLNSPNNTNAVFIDRWGMLSDQASEPSVDMSFLLVPEGKSDTDYGSVRLCIGMGGRSTQKAGSNTC